MLLDLVHDDPTVFENPDDFVDLLGEFLVECWIDVFEPFAGVLLHILDRGFGEKPFGGLREFAGNANVGNADNDFLQRSPFVMHFDFR